MVSKNIFPGMKWSSSFQRYLFFFFLRRKIRYFYSVLPTARESATKPCILADSKAGGASDTLHGVLMKGRLSEAVSFQKNLSMGVREEWTGRRKTE